MNGLNNRRAAQDVVLNNGFQYVSSAYCDPITHNEFHFVGDDYHGGSSKTEPELIAKLTTFAPPYRDESGLIEIPMHGLSDRNWFDIHNCVKSDEFNKWRKMHGHQPVAADWHAPWTAPDALDHWIRYNLHSLDRAYDQRAVWAPVWHPYSHYLHDRHNEMLGTLLQYAAAKNEKVWICTLRDVITML